MAATATGILAFDQLKFGFSHDKTWAAMPAALRGILSAERVRLQLGTLPDRIARSICTLCEIGEVRPVTTHSLRDHPGAGLKEVEGLLVGPGVLIRAKATCWHVRDERPVIPLLQPRKAHLEDAKLGVYAALGRRAFCKGDWAAARVEIIDLSGEDGEWRLLQEEDLELPSENDLNDFIATYVQAQELAAAARRERSTSRQEPPSLPLYDNPR